MYNTYSKQASTKKYIQKSLVNLGQQCVYGRSCTEIEQVSIKKINLAQERS
jgi:hypothetical protein